MSTLILERPQTFAQSNGWIINKRNDLVWFIGSSGFGYLAFFALTSGVPLLPLLVAWSLLIDGPHVFATVSRTYCDRQARQRLGWRLMMIIPLSMVGPAMWSVGLGKLFWVLFITWAQYHLAKQHLGFVMLYRAKAKERSDVLRDKRYILISLMTPWFLFLYSLGKLPAAREVSLISAMVFAMATVLYFRSQIKKLQQDEVSAQKLLLMLVVIPLPWMAFLYASLYANAGTEAFAIAAIATNIGHSLQYQRLTWFHNRNRYEGLTRSEIGLTALINTGPVVFLVTGIVLHFVLSGLPHSALYGNETWLSMLTGINMTHYYLDSKIWRVRSDKELAHALRLS